MDGNSMTGSTGFDKYREKLVRLMDSVKISERGWEFRSEQIEMIRDLAKEPCDPDLFEETRQMAAQYRIGMSPEQIYMDMIYKIAEAPTILHAVATAKLLIKEVYAKILEELKDEKHFDGIEICEECGYEFEFTYYPSRGEYIICPRCRLIQHPCSLCDDCNHKCCENLKNIRPEEKHEE